MNGNVMYRTIKAIDKKGNLSGRIVVATQPTNHNLTEFVVGFAFASLKDKWDKELGKKIAYGRMSNERSSFTIKRGDKMTLKQEIQYILCIDPMRHKPRWVRDAEHFV